jgi:hypothetical protein
MRAKANAGASSEAPDLPKELLDEVRKQEEERTIPLERILICSAGSYHLLIDDIRSGTARSGLPVIERPHFHIKFLKTPIDGVPETAGGCSFVVTPEVVKRMGYPRYDVETHVQEDAVKAYVRFCQQIEDQKAYGLKFAFLDDTEKADRILKALHKQADKEAEVTMEAMVEGVMRSDMALPGDRLV